MPKSIKDSQHVLLPESLISKKIHSLRGKNIMFDFDLAELYGVETKYLTRQVRRNLERFPEDFMFQLTPHEFLRCQFVTSKRGGRRYLPYVFTEQGVAMLSSVLNSKRAVMVNIQIMRAFVGMKRLGLTYAALKRKMDGMEKKYDSQFSVVFNAIRDLINTYEKAKESSKSKQADAPKRRIGFHAGKSWSYHDKSS